MNYPDTASALPLTGEHLAFRDMVKRFIAAEIMPHHRRWEDEGQVAPEVWRKAGALGILCPNLPEAYGGGGGNFLYSSIVIEEMQRAGASGLIFHVHSDIIGPYILHYGTEVQKRTWLPKMAQGDVITAIAMTEPDAGSDLAGIRTQARREGEHYVLNGQKTFISSGQLANLFIVAAKTDASLGSRGLSLFLVESDRKGFARGRNLEKIGLHAQDTAELFFNDVKIPASNLLGEEGRGFAYMMRELPQERLMVAIGAVASAEQSLRTTIEYVSQRRVFGKPLADKQHTRFVIAELCTEITIGRVFLDHCIGLHLSGKLSSATASMAKYWLTELQFRVLDACVQLHGGYGYMRECAVARAWADARVRRIYGGSNEIMKEIIGRAVLERR